MIVRIAGAAIHAAGTPRRTFSPVHRDRKTQRVRFQPPDGPSWSRKSKRVEAICFHGRRRRVCPTPDRGHAGVSPKRTHFPLMPFTVQKPCSAAHSNSTISNGVSPCLMFVVESSPCFGSGLPIQASAGHVVDQRDGLIEFGLCYLSEVGALRKETPQVTIDVLV